LLRVLGLTKSYRRKSASWRRIDLIAAASEIEFEIVAGQTLH